MTPHPQHCETCRYMKTHTSKGGLPFEARCEVSGYPPRDKIFENKLAIVGCASHSSEQSIRQDERDKVLDIGAILESLCNVDLYWYSRGSCESDDVGKCRGKDCNYCGRYSEELRTAAKEKS